MTSIKVGLDALNIQDSQHLKNSLINCDDPLKAISDFQEENSILLPTLKPALNLLDLHNVKRLEFHSSIADELKENLVKRIDELTASVHLTAASKEQHNEDLRKLEDLLDKSFPLINMPRLTSVILLIMKAIPKINDVYLNYMKDNENLYAIAPIEVKRQIWSLNNEVFLKELQPHFDKFIFYFDETITYSDFNIAPPPIMPSGSHHHHPSLQHQHSHSSTSVLNLDQPILKENLLLNSSLYPWFFKSHKRHQSPLVEICKLIGTSRRLYDATMAAMTSYYTKSHDWFYSTMKSQMLLKLAEMNNNESLMSIVSGGAGTGESNGDNVTSEMVFRFSSLINSCLREKKIEAKRAKELEAIMESKKFEKILPDVAFILADPFVIDMLSRNAMSLLNRCVQNELLPRNCTELIFVLRVLSISLLSWELIDTQANKEPKMDASLITEYLPSLAYFIADFYEKLYDDSLNNTTSASLSSTPPPPAVAVSILSTPQSSAASAAVATASTRTSPPIVLKISTRKLEIIASIKHQLGDNELCSCLFLYLVIVCFELNDWANLKVLLPNLKYPSNNPNLFEKWFMYQVFNILVEKSMIELFKNDWFVSLIFDDFLFVVVKQKDEPLQQQQHQQAHYLTSNTFYDQLYKLIEKIYPTYLSTANFNRLIDFLKPKKFHSSTIHIAYLKLKSKLDQSNSNELSNR